MRVLIVEPHASGHHASYLRWIVKGAHARRWRVVIATSRAALSHPSLGCLSTDCGDVELHLIADLPIDGGPAVRKHRLIRRELLYWKAFKRAAAEVSRQSPIDAVILPYIDYCFHALAILGSPFRGLPWCGISMRLRLDIDESRSAPRSPSGLKWRLARRILGGKTLRMLFSINPSVQDMPSGWCSPALSSKLRYVCEPAEFHPAGGRDEARTALGIDAGKIAILAFGVIDERKGIDSLLNALVSHEDLENYVVILAGRQSAGVRNQLRIAPGADLESSNRLIVMDRFLTDIEQNALFTAADVAWLGYRNHIYMSGVLVLAGRAGMPVLGTRHGEIGRLIAKYGLGLSVSVDRPAELTAALLEMRDARTRTEMGQRARTAFAGHTAENFAAEILDAIRCQESISDSKPP